MNGESGAQGVFDGEVWDAFCEQLKAAGKIILAPEVPQNEIDKAEGWRYLTRLLRLGLEANLEHADPEFPTFHRGSHETAKIGADNPDNIYASARIRGTRVYRIWGNRGTVPYLSFGTKASKLGVDGTMISTGEIDANDMVFAEDGSFELFLSTEPRGDNWLPMSPDSSTVIVRQTFLDRANETPASLNIECVNGAEKPAPLSAAQLQRGLLAAAQFVQGVAHTFAQWAELFRQRPNTLETTDQTMFAAAGGDPNIYYLHGYWDVPVDHALVIDTPVPECDLWNFQLNNYWMESLDYRFLPISVNKHTAKYNADGSVTIVVAATDPGVGNFIDTAGHTCGTMLLRWTGATSHPVPTCRLVKLDELRALRG